MARLICPNCSNAFTPPLGADPVCPKCHYTLPGSGPRAATPTFAPSAAPSFGGPGTFSPPPPLTAAPARAPTNGLAVASMVLGIVGLPLFLVFVPSLLALIFGIIGQMQIRKNSQKGTGMAVTGIVLGSLVVVAWIFFFVFLDALFDEF